MTAMIADDRSRSFASSRTGLTDHNGQAYDAFLKTLTDHEFITNPEFQP